MLGYNERIIEEEKIRLEEVKKNLTQKEIQQILDNMKRISEERNNEQLFFLQKFIDMTSQKTLFLNQLMMTLTIKFMS